MQPLISVIIPTYNRNESLKRCIQSVIFQTYQNFEILVMDDGSTDGTKEIVTDFNDPRIIYEWDDNWGGPAKPRNRGIKKSSGEFIAFLDSDDWWLPKKLEESVVVLEKGSDLVYHQLYMVKKTNSIIY